MLSAASVLALKSCAVCVEDRPNTPLLSERYRLVFAAFAAWRVHILHTYSQIVIHRSITLK